MRSRTVAGLAVIAVTTFSFHAPLLIGVASASTPETTFICDNSGVGLSAVDVLRATGNHDIFLNYLIEYDPDGYEILTNPELSDKTIWAPTDEAFDELGDAPDNATLDEIKAVLGFHITPPRRTPEGDYPIVTFEYLADGGQIIHQTRTGILTESDQRVRTIFEDGVYTVQGIRIGPTAWCTQAGSIFSIDAVITEVATPSWFERALGAAIYFFFIQNHFVTALAGLGLVLVVVGITVGWVRKRRT